MKKTLSLLFGFLLACAGVTFAQGRRPMTVDDEIDRVQVASPEISPDGQRVVFVRSDLNWKKNKRESRLYLVPAGGGEAIPFTAGPEDQTPMWSPDSRYVGFLRPTEPKEPEEGEDKKKKKQIWVIRTSGGEAFQLTDLSEGVKAFVWAPSSDRIVFSADDPKSKEEKRRLKDGDDSIYVFVGPNGQGRGSWSNIWVVGLTDKAPRQVTREKMLVHGLDISPAGDRVAFIFRRENARNNGNLAEVAVARLEDGKLIRLTENRAPESHLKWSPNGRELSYLAPDDKNWELMQPKLYILDTETRRYRVASGSFPGDIQDYAWSKDGKSIVLEAAVQTDRGIFKLDVASAVATPAFIKPGVTSQASFSADGSRAAFVWSDAATPPDVYAADLRPETSPTRLTEVNPSLKERGLASFKLITWKGKDGLPVEGVLYLPPGYRPGQRVPLILEIHGGPAGVFTNSWDGDQHILAGLGYATLRPNVRGSSAYGDGVLRGNMRDLGGGDYQDLMSGVDHLIAEGIADPEKLGVRGWSYGGILGGWVITQTDRFKAASLGAMVADWTSEYGQGFNHDVRLWYIGGEPWNNPEGYRRMSPLTHVKNVQTPTLILHGEEDTTDTIEQSMNFFNALWEQGRATRFIRYPREEHGLREPRHERNRLVEEIAWMQKHILGVDWTDVRKEEEEKKPADTPTNRP